MVSNNILSIIRFCKSEGRDLVFGDISSRFISDNRYSRVYTLFFDVPGQDRAVLRVTFKTTRKCNLKKGEYVTWAINQYNSFNKQTNSYANKYADYYGEFTNDPESRQALKAINDLVDSELPGRDHKYSSAACEYRTK